MEVNEKAFDSAFAEFSAMGNGIPNEMLSDFRNHPLLVKHEYYKYEILQEARNQLLTNTWKVDDIGTGRILTHVKSAIDLSINNLLDWRKKDDFKKLKPNRENERLLFDFFKSKRDDNSSFDKFKQAGFSYQLIAYLFFIKNPQKYCPISQEQFDKIFESLGFELKTNNNCSWENYLQFNDIIRGFRIHLSNRYQNVTLLDAHCFLWIYGFRFPHQEKKSNAPNKIGSKGLITNNELEEKSKTELEIYQPQRIIDPVSISQPGDEIDFLELHRKRMEIGERAEKIVLQNEIDFLKEDFPNLAEKVKVVSGDPMLGYDILSFETSGEEKHIEVKAISETGNIKSFIITRNELSKSKDDARYYVYCVSEINSEKPKILRLKNPEFENIDTFSIEPLTFKITFS